MATDFIKQAGLLGQRRPDMKWSSGFFRRPGWLLAIGIVVAVVLALSMLWDAIGPRCTHAILDRVPSPDGAWIAVIGEDTCDLGVLAVTDITAGVNLVTTRPTLRNIDVLGVDTSGGVGWRPRVAWSAPDALRVTVPLRSILKVLTRHAGRVRVDVQFDPDDPLARAAWLKQTGLPPDQ